jgi:hypothetical protein
MDGGIGRDFMRVEWRATAASILTTPRGKGYDTLAKPPAADASQQHHEGAKSGPLRHHTLMPAF